VKRQLPAMVYYRWVTPAEAGWLATIAARRAWLRAVRVRSGPDGVRALRAFQQAATELAFLRDRVERGVGPADAYYLHAELVHGLVLTRARAQHPLHAHPPPSTVIPPAAPDYLRR